MDIIKKSPIRLLVVDDQHHILDLFKEIFRKNEFELTTTDNALKAIEIMKGNSFHVMVTDVMMPDMNGIELLRKVKLFSPNTAIIVMTGHSTVEGAVDAIKQGAYDYLPKPIDIEKTLLTVTNAYRHYYMESKIDELSRLNTFSKKLNSFDNLQELLSYLLKSCLDELQSISGSILLLDEAENKLVVKEAQGPNSERLLNATQAVDEGVAGYVAHTREPLLVEDIAKDTRFKKRTSERYKNNSFLCIPLLNQNELLGIININNKMGNLTFSQTDLDTISVIANYSATTLARMKLHEKLQKFNNELNERINEATQDISKANQKLQDAIIYVENIIKDLSAGIVVFNEKNTIFFSNNAAKNLLENIPAYHTDSDILKFPIQVSGDSWKEDITNLITRNKTFHYDRAELEISDTESIPISISASLLTDHKKHTIGGILLLENISEKTELENKLRLSERVAFIGELAAKVAHELNNPLDGVIRYINLTKSMLPEKEEKPQHYLEQSLSGLNRMVSVVRGLLDFSRRSFQPEEETTMSNVIDEALSYLEHIRFPLHITVEKNIPDNLPNIPQGDLYHLYVNLIKNAYQAMGPNGKLTIKAYADSEFIYSELTDTGRGMDEITRKNVFKPFFTTKDPGQGTGLGLTICHDIIKRYNGSIDIKSKVGKGTTFIIKLPIKMKKKIVR